MIISDVAQPKFMHCAFADYWTGLFSGFMLAGFVVFVIFSNLYFNVEMVNRDGK